MANDINMRQVGYGLLLEKRSGHPGVGAQTKGYLGVGAQTKGHPGVGAQKQGTSM